MWNKNDKKEMYKTDYLRKGSFITKIADTGCFIHQELIPDIQLKTNEWPFMGKS